MLVAVHRANRDAFFGNNMHQLKTGPILRIPVNSEIGVIPVEEADKEVKNQIVDWNRQRASGLIEAKPKQTDTGKIESAADAEIGESSVTPHGFPKPFQGEESSNAGNNMGVTDPGGNGMGEKGIGGKRVNGRNSDGRGWR
jgi:FimV-like protein